MESHKKLANRLIPLCGQTIDCSSMKIHIQLQYSNTQGISLRFFENWKKSHIFRFFKTSQKTMETPLEISNRLHPVCGQTIDRSSMKFCMQLLLAIRRDFFAGFSKFDKKNHISILKTLSKTVETP